MSGTMLSGAAPAKLNLVLEVLGKRPDGYHELRSVMQTLELSDQVSIDLESDNPGVVVTGPFAAGTPTDATNLAWRAAAGLSEVAGRGISRLQIAIEKRIPPAGGLGGGASDAATTLKLLASAWRIDDSDESLSVANAIGSDEAFFLAGGTALISGRGDAVELLAPLPPHDVVLFIPPSTIPDKTGTLFQALGAVPFDNGERTERFRAARPALLRTSDTFNAFERVAFAQFPGLAAFRAAVASATGSEVRLAGAGPTLFWIGPPGDDAAIVAAARDLPGTVIATGTAP